MAVTGGQADVYLEEARVKEKSPMSSKYGRTDSAVGLCFECSGYAYVVVL